ncbi:MAG: TolC family protein [Pseudomonadota bacterium]
MNIKLKELSVDIAKAAEQTQSGAFDVNLSFTVQSTSSLIIESPYALGLSVEADDDDPRTYLDQDVHALSTSVSKKFRSGISTTLSYGLTQTDHRVPDPLGAEIPTSNSSQFNFKVDIPLLKGSGRVSTAAAEIAAGHEHSATAADYKHVVSKTILTTVTRYWDYVAAYYINAYLAESKQAIDKWHRKNNIADNTLLSGYRAEKHSRLIESRKVLQTAALALADAMGTHVNAMAILGKPDIDEFPKYWRKDLKKLNRPAITESWINMALQNRYDLQALKIRLEAAQILLEKAKNDLDPSLDLSLGYGTVGFSYGNHISEAWRASYDRVRTPAYSGALVLNYPLGNDAAKGTYNSNFAAKEIARLQLNEALRQVKLSIHNNVSVLVTSRNKAIAADKSLKSYAGFMQALVTRQSIDELKEINSLLTLQDRLDDAAVAYFNSLSGLANAIVNSRFEVGLLVSSTQALDEDINLQVLTSIPGL